MIILKIKANSNLSFLVLFTNSNTTSEGAFGFYPDRDNISLFSIRIPISAIYPKLREFSVSVKIENFQGYTCAQESPIQDLEIERLPCDHCSRGRLLVKLETKKENEMVSSFRAVLPDEKERMKICSLRPESRKRGQDLVITSPKDHPGDACRWVFRDISGRNGCCYSNRNYFNQTGGCDPRMQSPGCRKGVKRPNLTETQTSCIFRMHNLSPADSGNYLSKFLYETPGFKKLVFVKDEYKILILDIAIIAAGYLLFFAGIVAIFFLCHVRISK